MAKPLVETKAKVGVFSIALQAYLPQFPQLVPNFEAQYEAFKKTLPDTIEIIDGGMVPHQRASHHRRRFAEQLSQPVHSQLMRSGGAGRPSGGYRPGQHHGAGKGRQCGERPLGYAPRHSQQPGAEALHTY